MKGSILPEEIMIVNVYTPTNNVKIHEVKTYKTARRNTWIYYYNWRLNTPYYWLVDPAGRSSVRIQLSEKST